MEKIGRNLDKKKLKIKNKEIIWRIVFFLGIFVFLVNLCRITTLHFDAAMNNEVAYNLAKGNGYSTSYNGLRLFDHNIQTGAPVIIPTAILDFIFGCDYKFMQAVTLGYFFFFLILVYAFVKNMTNDAFATITILIMLFCPHIVENAYAGYGEICAGMWMMCSLLCFIQGFKTNKRILFMLCGCAIGFGFLTKTVFLICVPAFLFVLVEQALREKNLKNLFVRGGIMIGGAVIPITFFEVWKAGKLGFNAYIEWWSHEIGQIYWQTGVKNIVTGVQPVVDSSFLDKILFGLDAYSGHYGIPTLIAILLYSGPMIYLIIGLLKKKNISIGLQWLIMMANIYFVWYVAIMPSHKSWARRCVLGHCFLIITYAIIIYKFCSFIKEQNTINFVMKRVIYGTIASVIVLFSMQQINSQKIMIGQYVRADIDIYRLVEFVKTLPQDADYYAYGWWRNSHVITENNVKMYNLAETTEISEESYYIVQYPQTYVEPGLMEYIVAKTNAELLFETETCYVFKLRPMKLEW